MPEDSTSSDEYEENVVAVDERLAYQAFDTSQAECSPYVGMTYAHFEDRKVSNKQNNVMALQRYFNSCTCVVALLQYDGEDEDCHIILLFDNIDRCQFPQTFMPFSFQFSGQMGSPHVKEFVKSRALGTLHVVQFFKPKQRVVRKVISMLKDKRSVVNISPMRSGDETDSLQMSTLCLDDAPSKSVDECLTAGDSSGQNVTSEDAALVQSRTVEIEFVSEDKGAQRTRNEVMDLLAKALQSSAKLDPTFVTTAGHRVPPHFFLVFTKNSEAIQVMSGLRRQERKFGVIFRRATTSNLVAKEVLQKCLVDGEHACFKLPKLSEAAVPSPSLEANPRPTRVPEGEKPSRRVNTSGHVARRLVENSLGLRSTVSRDQLRAENRMVKDAAAAKRDAKNNRIQMNEAFD